MTTPDALRTPLPLRIVVGVVGHLDADAASVRPRVDAALAEIRRRLRPHAPERVAFTALSPLAEGADRIVADAVLATGDDARLDVVLPFERVEYVKTFADRSAAGVAPFDALLNVARRVVLVPPQSSRDGAFAAAGRYVVDRCDVLVAIHDPTREDKKGGTGEALRYAVQQNCLVVRIHPRTSAPAEIPPLAEVDAAVLARMDEFAAPPRVWDAAFAVDSARRFDDVLDELAAVAPDAVAEVRNRLLPAYHRANVVAVVSKRRYRRAAISGYALGALAVTVAALDRLLPEHVAKFAPLVEVAVLVAVVVVVIRARWWRRWHETWLDHRFLAEQFRSAVFLAVAGREVARLRTPRTLRDTKRRAAYRDSEWIVRTHAGVVGGLKRLRAPDRSRIEDVAKALAQHWVRAQRQFHETGGPEKADTHHALTWGGLALFALAIVAASLRTLRVGPDATLEFLCLALPAIGAALAAIRVHGEYERSAMRSEEVLEPLAAAHDRLAAAKTPEDLARALLDVEATLRFESEDWRVVHRFRDVDLPG